MQYQQNSEQEMLIQFFQQLPPEMQEKIQMLPPEKQIEVLTNLIQRSQQQQFDLGGSINNVPVEAEKNENITTQNGLDPEIEEGGYAIEKSFNPISGKRTYELPNNEENNSHEEGGIKMQLSKGDVINSDKTKIPTDFKIYGRNFKSKSFKDASDYISSLEKKEEVKTKKLIKENKFDEVTQNTSALVLAKLAMNRNNLNNLQEKVLDFKKQNEEKELVAEYGTLVQNMYDKEDAYYNAFKPKERLIAQKGLNASFDKFKSFSDKVMSNPNINLNQVMDLFRQSGLNTPARDNTYIKQPLIQNYSFKNPPKINTVGKGVISDSKLIEDTIKLSKKYGVDPAFALATIDIESKGKSNAVSKTGATGLWQFTEGTGKQYGLINQNGDNRKDYYANLEAGFKLAKDNQVYLQKNGLPATPENLYLAHQQGLGGAKQIISNALYGTPISAQVREGMRHNWGSNKSGAEYLQYTKSTVTPLVNYYEKYLTDLQQKNDLKSIGESNNTGKSIPQKKSLFNFKNIFQEGGRIYAQAGELVPYKVTKYDNEIDSEPYWRDLYAYYASDQSPLQNKFSYNPNEALTKEKQEEFQQFLYDNLGANFIRQYLMTQEPSAKARRQGVIESSQFDGKSDDEIKEIFMDGLRGWRAPVVQRINEINLPEGGNQVKGKNDIIYTNYGEKYIDKYKTIGQTYYTIPENERLKFSTLEEYNDYIKNVGSEAQIYDNRSYYYDKTKGKFINPYIEDNTNLIDDKKVVEENSVEKNPLDKVDKEDLKPVSKPISILDKLKYGLRESLPYLDNLRLLRERRIMPVLQQKPYQNPYDNFITDTNIQSSLNDADRMYLTSMADSRGNPSVRNARMAQIMSNITDSKNQMYTQKYNMDNQLKNQKSVGQSQYLNNWEDINRDLRKRYETEVLQTVENQRQQKHMAIDKMMNDYLRKQEQNSSRDLALLETNYNWNPYNQSFEFDPEKAKQNFEYQKITHNDLTEENKRLKALLKEKGIL